MSNSDTIGSRIKLLRETRKETQADLAKALRVKRETVNQWENETRDIKTQYTVSLAEHFEETCDYILRGIKAENISVHEKTGLSEKAIQAIINIKNNEFHYRFKRIPALTSLLEYDHIPGLLSKITRFIRVVEDSKTYRDNALDVFDDGIDTKVLNKKLDDLDAALSEYSGVSKELLDLTNLEEFVLFGVQDSFIKTIKDIASYEKED